MRVARVAVLSIAFIASVPVQAAKRGSYASGYMYSYYIPPAAGSPWRPCWSPDGREIAFSMSGSIWKIKPGDSVAHELTANPTYDSEPAWSPDGRWIAYTAEDSQGVNLMLMNMATGESTLLAGGGFDLKPTWSPDGSKLAYLHSEIRGRAISFTCLSTTAVPAPRSG